MVNWDQECLIVSCELPEVLEVATINLLLFFFFTFIIFPILLVHLLVEIPLLRLGTTSTTIVQQPAYRWQESKVIQCYEFITVFANESYRSHRILALFVKFCVVAQEIQTVQVDVSLALIKRQHEGSLIKYLSEA
jgi:hypothetical protein